MLTGHRAKLAAAIRSAQDDVRRQLLPQGQNSSGALSHERVYTNYSRVCLAGQRLVGQIGQKSP